MAQERVQKILAQVGLASRRQAEELIREGEVTINGQIARIGDKADLQTDAIKVKGKLLLRKENPMYVAFFKPKSVISMMVDPEGRTTIETYLNRIKTRLFPIGRLDFNSEGLLLLTNDGELAEKIQKSDDLIRIYHVKIKGEATPEILDRLRPGMTVGRKMYVPTMVRQSMQYSKKSLVEIAFQGSGAFDVRAFFEQRGILVDKVTRFAIGHITLKGLIPGAYRFLEATQINALIDQPELGLKLVETLEEKRTIKLDTSAEDRNPKLKRKKLREEREAAEAAEHAEAGELGEKPLKKTLPLAGRGGASRKPAFGPRAPRSTEGRSERGSFERRERPSFGRERSSERSERSSFGRERSFDRSERPSFGRERNSDRGERRPFGGDRAPRGERSSFARTSDSRAPRGDRPAWGERAPRGEKKFFGPQFGASSEGRREDRGGRPSRPRPGSGRPSSDSRGPRSPRAAGPRAPRSPRPRSGWDD